MADIPASERANADVLNRVDSLIQPGGRRRRSFLAAPPAPEANKAESALPPADEDIPVLTEVVPADAVPPEAAVSEPAPDRFDETLVSILAADLAHSIEQRLGIEIPSLIEATLENLEHDLRRGIVAATEAALRDFLDRRQQLRLPLDEPQRQD